jgi:hypothetical protein
MAPPLLNPLACAYPPVTTQTHVPKEPNAVPCTPCKRVNLWGNPFASQPSERGVHAPTKPRAKRAPFVCDTARPSTHGVARKNARPHHVMPRAAAPKQARGTPAKCANPNESLDRLVFSVMSAKKARFAFPANSTILLDADRHVAKTNQPVWTLNKSVVPSRRRRELLVTHVCKQQDFVRPAITAQCAKTPSIFVWASTVPTQRAFNLAKPPKNAPKGSHARPSQSLRPLRCVGSK